MNAEKNESDQDHLCSVGSTGQEPVDGCDLVVQRRRDELARLLIKIRRGEAGYKQAMTFLYENKGLPPQTEAVDL
jgi:hypothetical protein